jgi:glycosyltransferase involved in cell wall biosynthesis
MTKTVSIIMPAFRAEPTIAHAVASVLAQTHKDWALVVISDDETDYRAFLAGKGIADPRITFLGSGMMKGGASRARNIGLDAIDTPYAAVLDADDAFKPEKLARVVAALAEHGIVSTALDVMSDSFLHRRFVAKGQDRKLAAGEHKWVNLSMDTMIAWDRAKADARYDPDLPNLTDLDFLLKLYRTCQGSFHIGTPLHDYVKLKVSMSNGPGVTERMVRVKNLLLARLAEGYYPMADAAAKQGVERFLRVSLVAEESYEAAMAEKTDLLFEDHLEPMLEAAVVA